MRHCLKRVNGKLTRAELKTPSSRRTLRMPKAVAATLAALCKHQAAERLRAGQFYRNSGLVFCDALGRPRHRQAVWRSWRDVTEAAGLGTGWQPRETRHTWVSHLSDHDVPVERIADAAGHVNSNVTRTVYRHLIRDEIAVVADVWDTEAGS